MDVRSIKLSTGEEVVAVLVKETGMGYSIKNPLVVHMMKSPQGPSLGFAQWSMIQAPDVEIELLNHAVMSVPVPVIEEVEASYLEQTTGIALPPKTTGQILHG
jgi:hypothetical protein